MASDTSPEHLLDVFRTAALSVTKLYKSSIDAQRKARAEGYQDCLDELLQFMDKEHLGLDDGEGWKIRAWANEHLENRELSPQQEIAESDDDSEKLDVVSSPEIHRSNSNASLPRVPEPHGSQHTYLKTIVQEPQSDSPKAPYGEDIVVDEPEPEPAVVPSRDTFDFQSSMVYPDARVADAQNNLNLAALQLSDSSRPEHTTSHTSSTPTPRKAPRRARSGRPNRGTNHLAARTGSKRHMDFTDFFDLSNVKEFGPPAKRSRH